MQNVKHIAQNAGHTMEMTAAPCQILAAPHLMLATTHLMGALRCTPGLQSSPHPYTWLLIVKLTKFDSQIKKMLTD